MKCCTMNEMAYEVTKVHATQNLAWCSLENGTVWGFFLKSTLKKRKKTQEKK